MSSQRLIFLSGPLQGQTVPIEKQEITIGRDDTNRIVLNHPSVSRNHCRIQPTGEGPVLFDMESKNGTFVDGIPTRSVVLHQGNEIRIGNSRLLFLEMEEKPQEDFLNDEEVTGRSTILLSEEELIYADRRKLATRVPAVAERLSQLLSLATTAAQARSHDELVQAVFPALAAVVPARRAALLPGPDVDHFAQGWFWMRESGMVPALRLSRTILRRAVSQRACILQNEIFAESAPSLLAEGVRSLVCVPLLRPNQVLGVLYLDSSDPVHPLTEEHLQFVAAAAGILALALENLRLLERLREENRYLKQEAAPAHGIVGDSSAIRKVFDFIRKAGGVDATVLLLGESGTGKELAARAIHQGGTRAEQPFVVVNCAALTESLLESDLFGHEKGAFTGAVQQHKGKFERADGGTIFLDEVAELTPAVQAKLLRVLQEREFERVGGSRPIRVDVRVIAATNRDLQEEVRKGSFREDLYYRLNVLAVRMPALRERPDDISLLVSHFLARAAEAMHKPQPELSSEARAFVLQYSWPGNVRELENAMERAIVLSESETIRLEDLPESLVETLPRGAMPMTRFHEAVAETKSRLILDAIQAAAGNITEAAQALGINANYLHRLIRNLNLRSRIKEK